MGHLWDGNEVWLITAGGVTFSAFPKVYAVMFSSLYSALMLILFGLILRGVSFEFRGKVDSPVWKKIWDGCMFVGSLLTAVLFGVPFANIFRGIPIDGQGMYHGTPLRSSATVLWWEASLSLFVPGPWLHMADNQERRREQLGGQEVMGGFANTGCSLPFSL